MATFNEAVRFNNTVTVTDWSKVTPGIPRINLLQQTLDPFVIPLTEFRVWNAMHTNLPGTSATDDLALTSNGVTDSVTIQTSDLDSAGATTRYASVLLPVPAEYVGAQTLTLRFHAGMKTNVADNTATLDVEAYLSDEEEGLGADICATAVTTINSVTLADIDFTITPATLSPGSLLLVRIAVAVNDAATGAPVIGIIGSAKLLCDTQG